jgi:hypothetical protein
MGVPVKENMLGGRAKSVLGLISADRGPPPASASSLPAESEACCHVYHAVDLFSGLQGESPENGSFPGFGWRLLGILGPRSSNIGLQRLLAMRKARV